MNEMLYEKIADRIREMLSTSSYSEGIVNGFDSVEFNAIVADVLGEPEPVIVKSRDYNEGAFSNELEWAKSFIMQLRTEMLISQATGDRLNYWGELVGIERMTEEADDSYRLRIIKTIRAPKLTKYALKTALSDFFTDDIKILDYSDAMFTGLSFNGFYETYPPPNTIMPAIIRGAGSAYYFEIIIPDSALEGFDPEYFAYTTQLFTGNQFVTRRGTTGLNWARILQTIDNTKVAGVTYNVYIGGE